MAIIFDGKAFASKKEEELKSLGKHPKLASILIGSNPASLLYVNLKKKFAERVGATLEIASFDESVEAGEVKQFIEDANADSSVDGIMIQLPLPEVLRSATNDLVNSISPLKDVDGLGKNSMYLHPTSRAVIEIISESGRQSGVVCVVGATGMVGRPLVKDLKEKGFEVIECDHTTKNLKEETLKADILVSATGVPGLIKADMVKDGVVVIDVGSPKGDVDFDEVAVKASFITPVPGGVGPVTIACLLENLLSS